MAKFGVCGVCRDKEAKYKCPKCDIVYCCLACFKDPRHDHHQVQKPPKPADTEDKRTVTGTADNCPVADTGSRFERLLSDPAISAMLRLKPLQVHLAVLIKILLDPAVTNEATPSARMEVANMKLCELRMGGPEENELVEEFVGRVVHLLDTDEQRMGYPHFS